jgi:hypothetical protein
VPEVSEVTWRNGDGLAASPLQAYVGHENDQGFKEYMNVQVMTMELGS